MKKIIDTLTKKITKLEKETNYLQQLDVELTKRLKQNQRQSTLDEIKLALEVLELNAQKQATQELYIYAIPHQPIILLDANQTYSFKHITLQEIKFKTMLDLDEGIKPLWNTTNRLTLYEEFKDRANRLINKIEAEELDDCINYSASKLLYEILGVNGELLEQIEIDKTKSYTTTRIRQIIQQAHDYLNIFTDPTL